MLINFQGKGFPDVNTRLMVRKLWDTLQIPIFGLVDADPHGKIASALIRMKLFRTDPSRKLALTAYVSTTAVVFLNAWYRLTT